MDAEYGFPRHVAFRGDPDVWKVTIDVSSLGWDMTYEGPGPKLVNGEMRYPSHVRVPKVHALVILIHDKMKRRIVTGTEPEPDQEHRIEWRTRSDYRRG